MLWAVSNWNIKENTTCTGMFIIHFHPFLLFSTFYFLFYHLRFLHWNNSEAQSALRQAPPPSSRPSHPWSQRPGAGDAPLSLHASLPGPGRAGAHQAAPLLPRQAGPQPQLWHRVPRPPAHKWPRPEPAGRGGRARPCRGLRFRTVLVPQQGLPERRGKEQFRE